MFFDDHPRFLDTSQTYASLDRLNLRHEAIITDNADVLVGARVLDIASHDGRWSFAALQAGAAHVTGLEARPHLVANARANLTGEGAADGSYEFVCTDVFDWLDGGVSDVEVDVVLCLGFLYHTMRYPELFAGLRSSGASHVILDTEVLPPRFSGPTIQVRVEDNSRESNAVADRYAHRERTLVGKPSVDALGVMFELHGFEIEKIFDWSELLDRFPSARQVELYRRQTRVTLRAEQRAR